MTAPQAGDNSQTQLLSIIERVERLREDKKAIEDDIKDVFAEAKGNGFDVPALRQIIKERAEDARKRKERESILDTYRLALGMLDETPLGRAALEREGLA